MTKESEHSILLVENDQSVMILIKYHLEREGFCVLVAENGLEALEKLQEEDVDLILSEIMIPGMDDIAFQKELRQKLDRRQIPLVFLIAKAQIAEQIKVIETGVDEYITKPFDPSLLVAKIKAVFESMKTFDEKTKN